MRLISAGSLVRIQSGPPFNILYGLFTDYIRFFENYTQLEIKQSADGSIQVEPFLIKLERAYGGCLGAKRL